MTDFMVMLTIFLIFLVGLTPPLYSLWVLRRADNRVQIRLSQFAESVSTRRPWQFEAPADLHYVEGFGYAIGNIACRYNARSPHIRCAVNPMGPCSECNQYEPTPDDANLIA